MARQKGMLNLSGNLEPLAGAPLDSRTITPTVADLYIASNWPYKYIGMKTTVTATGDTYRLVNLDVTQESSWVKEGGESGQTIQYDELPAASSSLVGEIYQYTGTTNLQYTNGYFYECVNDGGTYKWVQTNTQPGTSYSDFTGATSQTAGAHGLVPAPTTGDISKFLKGDGTWATVPMPSFDYSNTSPEAMNFSTDEKVIGTWIDGKPLYQKVVKLPDQSSVNQTVSLDITNLNIDKLIECFGVAKYNNTRICPIPIIHPDPNMYQNVSIAGLDCNSVLVKFACYNFGSLFTDNYTTLRYTKTTDSAVASGEKIVGQWIDGKPLYEKRFSIDAESSRGMKNYSLSIDNADFIGLNFNESYVYGTYNNKTEYIPIMCVWDTGSTGGYILTKIDNSTVNFSWYRNNWEQYKAYVTIRYTKTT